MLLKSAFDFCTVRGSNPGGVFVRSLAGIFLRNNAVPTKKFSPSQQSYKSYFFQSVNLYKSLSVVDLIKWSEARYRYLWYECDGTAFVPQSFELFTSLNIQRFRLGIQPFIEPPPNTSIISFSGFIILECTLNSLVLRTLVSTIPANTILFVYAYPQTDSPISSYKDDFVLIGTFDETTLQSFSIYNEYTQQHPIIYENKYVNIACRLYTIESGLFGSYSYDSNLPT